MHKAELRGANQAEAQIVVAIVRGVVVPVRYGTVVRIVVPTAPTFDAVRARRGTTSLVFC